MSDTTPRADATPTELHDVRATVAERRAAGRAARQQAPRRALGDRDGTDRGHDALGTILAQNTIRVPELLPIRHGRMSASPWNYYRGAAAVMAADLATTASSGLEVQLCGDAHVLNFGLWATPVRNLLFVLRDFDVTLPGPFEWDVKRLAASLHVRRAEQESAATRTRPSRPRSTPTNRMARHRDARARHLVRRHARRQPHQLLRTGRPGRGVGAHREEGQAPHEPGRLRQLTSMVDGRPPSTRNPRSASSSPTTSRTTSSTTSWPSTASRSRRTAAKLFDRFTVVDVVRQVVGVGSVGMRVYLVLLEGRSGDDPLFLQVKQAGASVYEAFTRPSQLDHHGARVITGKRLIQSATDIFVGWGSLHGRDFYVRQFRDMKIIPSTELIAPRLVEFAAACGETLARAHARSGDPEAISAYIGGGKQFRAGLRAFARRYADQNERDHAQLVAAISAGTVEAAPGW
jgi:uncharacterized protein (DUF2252 family)